MRVSIIPKILWKLLTGIKAYMKMRKIFLSCRVKKLWSFSAIGNPSSFEQTLACIGIDIIEAIRYPDHHDYGMLEMQYISERAISKEVVAMVTTGKDAVKIPTEFIYFNREMPLYILNMDIKITEGREVFEKTILNAIQKETNE